MIGYHYILDDSGEPFTVYCALRWDDWFEFADRQIAFDQIGDMEISTVFTGINRRVPLGREFPPLLWETLVFNRVTNAREEECYASRKDAIDGHSRYVFMARERGG